MDIPRQTSSRSPRRRFLLGSAAVISVLLMAGISSAVAANRGVDGTLDADAVVLDTVRRGAFIQEIRASGVLAAERMRHVVAVTAGRVERLPVLPGATVGPTEVLAELSNPDVDLQALEADRQVATAVAEMAALRGRLTAQQLNQEAAIALLNSQAIAARRAAQTAVSLGRDKLIARNDVDDAKETAEQMAARLGLEKRQLANLAESAREQLAHQRGEVTRLRAIAAWHNERIGALRVTAGMRGVLQELSLEPGQWASPGMLLAMVADTSRLKAVLTVSELAARNVVVGQRAMVDTYNGETTGHVTRVHLAVVNGSVTVEVALDSAPDGAQIDRTVEARIEVERVANALSILRPVNATRDEATTVFRLTNGGRVAVRTPVQLSGGVTSRARVLQGLSAKDIIIVNDMSDYSGLDRLRLK